MFQYLPEKGHQTIANERPAVGYDLPAQLSPSTTTLAEQVEGAPNQSQERPTEGIRCRGIGSKVDGMEDNTRGLYRLQKSLQQGLNRG